MPSPNDESGRPPFAKDDGPGDSGAPPAPPVMRSPYRPGEQLPGEQPEKHPQLRLPSLHHGSGHDDRHAQPPAQQPALPAGQRPVQGAPSASGWGTGAAGAGGEGSSPPPLQFSYRPQPQPPVAPEPEAPRNGRRNMVIWASLGTALVVVAVAVSVLGMGKKGTIQGAGPTSSDSTTVHTATTTAKPAKNMPAAWSAPAGGDSAAVVGSWLVDNKTVVRGDSRMLKAYDTETGHQQWTFQPPGQGAAICAMSQVATSKIGMVQYGPAGACTTIAAVDTDNGKAVWNTTLVVPKGSPPGTAPVVSLDNEVTVGLIGTTLTAWTSADGKQVWTTDLAKAKPACRPGQFGSQNGNLALIEDCGKGPVVATKNAHNGRDLWSTPLPTNGLQGAQFAMVHASPTIVHAMSNAAQPVDRYYSFDAAGKLLPPINGSGDYGALDLNAGSQGQQHPVAYVQDNVFIVPTADKDAKASLVAFDLPSGGKLWQAPATAAGPVTIVSVNKKWVTVLDDGSGKTAARMVAFGTSSGGPTASGADKGTLGTDWTGSAAAAYIAGDRVVVLPAAPEKGADVLAFAWGDAQ